MDFHSACKAAGLSIHSFSRLSGIHYKTVVSWDQGKAIPPALRHRVFRALDMDVIATVARNLQKDVRVVLSAAVSGIHDGHRSTKHGRYVGPKGRPFGGSFSTSGLFFSVYQEVFEGEWEARTT